MSLPNPAAPAWVQRLYPVRPDRPPTWWGMTPIDWIIHTVQVLSGVPLAVAAFRFDMTGAGVFTAAVVFMVSTAWGLHRALRAWAAQAHLAQWLNSDQPGNNPDDQLPGYRP